MILLPKFILHKNFIQCIYSITC